MSEERRHQLDVEELELLLQTNIQLIKEYTTIMADLTTALSDLSTSVAAVTAQNAAQVAQIADLQSQLSAIEQPTADAIETQVSALDALVPPPVVDPAAPVDPAAVPSL